MVKNSVLQNPQAGGILLIRVRPREFQRHQERQCLLHNNLILNVLVNIHIWGGGRSFSIYKFVEVGNTDQIHGNVMFTSLFYTAKVSETEFYFCPFDFAYIKIKTT